MASTNFRATSKRASGKILTSLAPAWLRREGDKFVVIPERAAIVNELFLLTIAGNGRRKICSELNKRKINSFGKSNCGGWWPSTISTILHNEAVIGRFQAKKQILNELGKTVLIPDGEPREDYFPKIIEVTLWQQVQERLASCKKIVKGSKNLGAGRPSLIPAKNMFQGILYDGYHPQSKMALGWGHDYFISDWHRLTPSDDIEPIRWNIAELESAVLRYLRELDFKSLVQTGQQSFNPDEIRLAEFKTKLNGVNKRAEQVMDTLETCEDNGQRAMLMKRLSERAKEKIELEATIEQLKAVCNAWSWAPLLNRCNRTVKVFWSGFG
jgi:hypothetical protein